MTEKKIKEKPLENLRKKLGKKYGAYLRKDLRTEWVAEKTNPWDVMRKYHHPSSANDHLEYSVILPSGGAQYGSFSLTNTSKRRQDFTPISDAAAKSNPQIELFEVPFVPVTEGTELADPLIPLESKISVDPGLTKLIFFRIEGEKTGSFENTIRIIGRKKTATIKIRAVVTDLSAENGAALNANVWAYFTYPILKDRKPETVRDLHEHHINTMVIPPAAIPKMDASDFSKLSDYLKDTGPFEKILLYNSYTYSSIRNGYKGGIFLSEEWKVRFKKWYARMLDILSESGYSPEQVYYYPYDEVKKEEDIEDFINLMEWAKRNMTEIQFYATSGNKSVVAKVMPLVDIMQIYPKGNVMEDLPASDAEVWIYETISQTRSLHPYSYYRLMSWRAFAEGYQGIGFWNYADNGRDSNPIDQLLINTSRDYAMIYTGSGTTIYSSRRWEAFRLGLEDYQILQSYSKKFGFEKTKERVDAVLSAPDQYELADDIREQMLEEI